jgi:hypothetical protein
MLGLFILNPKQSFFASGPSDFPTFGLPDLPLSFPTN